MRILLLGKNGQLGWELQRSLALFGEVLAPDRDDAELCGDLSKPEGLQKTVRKLEPNVIVNAAAYTEVDKAESEPQLAQLINAESPNVLAQEASRFDAWLVHYSTDYVFNGKGNNFWSESDEVAPLSVYGKSKRAGEQAITASGCQHLIFRTSWVYGRHGKNFLKTMLKLGVQRDQLSVVNDQIGAPTGAELIADATAHALRQAVQGSPAFSGLYHLTTKGEVSWYDYALYIMEIAKQYASTQKLATINPVPTSEYPTMAPRPLNSRLDVSLFETTFGLILPDWKKGVARVVNELLSPR